MIILSVTPHHIMCLGRRKGRWCHTCSRMLDIKEVFPLPTLPHTPSRLPYNWKERFISLLSVRTHPVYRQLECYSASHYNIFISHLWKGEADASDWRSGVWLVCGALRGILWFFSGVHVIWQAPREWGLFHDQCQIHIFILGKITFGVLYQHKFL